jgi:hypothetical protein
MAARTELSGPACTGFDMEPNPKNAGQNQVIIVIAEEGRRETTASKDWDMTRRKRSNGDTDERERERRVLRPDRLWKRSGRRRLKSIFTKNLFAQIF